jgi:hypothetical protein
MKRVIAAVLFALVFTLVPLGVMRLESETRFVSWCTYVASRFMVPGILVGVAMSDFRVHDVNMILASVANFVFYFLFACICLLGWEEYKQRPQA